MPCGHCVTTTERKITSSSKQRITFDDTQAETLCLFKLGWQPHLDFVYRDGDGEWENHPQAMLEAATPSKIISSNKQVTPHKCKKSDKPGTF